MAKRTWKFDIEGKPHLVELKHGSFTGKRKVWLDSKEVINDQKLFDSGSQYRFFINSQPCDIGVVTNGISFDFYLLVNGKPVTPQNSKRRPSKLLKQTLNEKKYWYELAERTGLEYYLPEKNHGIPQHRLFGAMSGFLMGIQTGPSVNRAPSYFLDLTIRCRPTPDPKEVEKAIRKDPDLRRLAGNLLVTRVENDHVWLRMGYYPKKDTAAMLAAKIAELTRGLSRYLSPSEAENCEGQRCKARPYPNPGKLVLVNNIPYLLCETCNKDIPTIIENEQQQNRNDLLTVVLAIIFGGVGILIGAVLFALVGVYLNLIAAVVGLAIFFGILKLMNLAGAKTNLRITLLAGALSFISVVLGVYLTIVLYVIKEYNAPISFELFYFSGLAMFEDLGLLLESLFYSGLGILSYGWSVLRGRTGAMKPLSKPKIEKIE